MLVTSIVATVALGATVFLAWCLVQFFSDRKQKCAYLMFSVIKLEMPVATAEIEPEDQQAFSLADRKQLLRWKIAPVVVLFACCQLLPGIAQISPFSRSPRNACRMHLNDS